MNHANKDPTASQDGTISQSGLNSQGLEESSSKSLSSGGSGTGQAGRWSAGSYREGEDRTDSPSNEHHLRERHLPRVQTLSDVERLESEIQESFAQGDPSTAWQKSQELISLAKDLARQAAKDRFNVNYGTSTCDHCSGLKAGPDVIATCFQIRQCNYSNVKKPSPRQTDLIARLTKE